MHSPVRVLTVCLLFSKVPTNFEVDLLLIASCKALLPVRHREGPSLRVQGSELGIWVSRQGGNSFTQVPSTRQPWALKEALF